jgi:hypothetical protein
MIVALESNTEFVHQTFSPPLLLAFVWKAAA